MGEAMNNLNRNHPVLAMFVGTGCVMLYGMSIVTLYATIMTIKAAEEVIRILS